MGKSTAAAWIQEQGIAVIDTDDIAREVVQPGSPVLLKVIERFGSAYLDADGRLNRKALAELVFEDSLARRDLESIVHPPIFRCWNLRVERLRQEGVSIVVVVIPLLFENGYEASFDKTLCVACTGPTQQERLMQRGWSLANIQARLKAQWTIQDKMERSSTVIWSEGSLRVLHRQLELIFATL